MKLQDIIDKGGYCVWAGVQRRELVPLVAQTCQGGGATAGTLGDAVMVGTRGTTFYGPRGFITGSSGTELRFGRGER